MRLLKTVDYKLKVHLIINTSSKRENTINLGSESLGAISSWRLKSSIDRLSFLELRHPNTTPKSAGMCQRKVNVESSRMLLQRKKCFVYSPMTFCPASESSARQQRLFVQHQVTKQHVCCMFIWFLCRTN